jgi:hypothetical protein
MKPAELTGFDKQFYPTPIEFAMKILSGINFDTVQTVLEPSAGTGNLIEAVFRKCHLTGSYNTKNSISVDAIEIDPHLREILRYDYINGGKTSSLKEERKELNDVYYERGTRPDSHTNRIFHIDREIGIFNHPVRIVHDDFLTFKSYKNMI